MNDGDIKKITKLISTLITPVKELVEIIKHKVEKVEFLQMGYSDNVRMIRDQQSVMNKKLDEVGNRLDRMEESLQANTASVIQVEATLEGYADMYKINKNDLLKHEKRISKVESKLEIVPPPELTIVR